MRHPALPDARRRVQAAEVTGEMQRLCFGNDRVDRLEWAVARIHEITTDPLVLGHVLGTFLAYADRSDVYLPAVEMLRAAGADEGQAELKAAWLRQEIAEGRHLF